MKQLLHILEYKFISWIKFKSRYDFISLVKSLGSSVVYILFAIGAYLFSLKLIEYLLVNLKLGLFLIHEFLSIILFIFFLSINVGNIIVFYSTLFRSSEVNYYFSHPISPTKIFIIKFLDNFFYSSGTLFFILISLLAGYAVYFNISIYKIVLILLVNIIPFMFSAASLGVIVLFIILKLASKITFRGAFYLTAFLYAVVIYFFFEYSSPVDLVNNVMSYYPNVDLYFADFLPSSLNYLPNRWLSFSMYWLLKGKLFYTVSFIVLQISTSLILFMIAVLIGKKYYHELWLTLPTLRNIKKKSRIDAEHNSSGVFGSTISILTKEFKLFFREPSQVIHGGVLLFLLVIFISSVSSVQLYGTKNTELQTIIFLSVYVFNIFLTSTLSLRFIFPLISLEGNAFWTVKTSPISLSKYLLKKIAPYFLIILLLSASLTFFSTRLFYVEMRLFCLLNGLLITISIILLNFGLGGLFANYKEKNPIRLSSSQGASVTFLLTLFYMIFIVIVLFFPISQYFDFTQFRIRFEEVNFITPLLIIFTSSAIISVTSLLFLRKSISSDF